MSRRGAIVLLVVIGALFLLGILDVSWANPQNARVPERVLAICSVVLSGVAIGYILSALRNGSRTTPDDPDDPEADRSRQTARQDLEREQEDHHDG